MQRNAGYCGNQGKSLAIEPQQVTLGHVPFFHTGAQIHRRASSYNPFAMKRAAFVLFLALPAFAQPLPVQVIKQTEQLCHGAFMAAIDSAESSPTLKDRNAVPAVGLADPAFVAASERITAVFKSDYPNNRVLVALTSTGQINAWTVINWGTDASGRRASLVCIPTAFVRFMGNEDELAFTIAHEFGHAVDEACRLIVTTATVARGNKVLCEMRADEIGYQLTRQAEYSPYAAAGAFGRLEMYFGDTQTGILGIFRQLAIDHPITPKRIENMRRLLIADR
jgi:Zn-dependent protease with chaperone function